jgi:hypothetical protein
MDMAVLRIRIRVTKRSAERKAGANKSRRKGSALWLA